MDESLPKTEEIVGRMQELILSALQIPDLPSGCWEKRRLGEIMSDLEIHLYFPQLSAEERALIYALQQCQAKCFYLINEGREDSDAEPVENVESLRARAEKEFMDAKAAIVSTGIREKLSPVQLQVLDEAYSRIAFEK